MGEELRRICATVKAWLQQLRLHAEVCVDRTGFRSDRRVVAQTKYRESFERMAKSLRLWTACPRSTSQQTSQTDSPAASRILPATRRLPLFRELLGCGGRRSCTAGGWKDPATTNSRRGSSHWSAGGSPRSRLRRRHAIRRQRTGVHDIARAAIVNRCDVRMLTSRTEPLEKVKVRVHGARMPSGRIRSCNCLLPAGLDVLGVTPIQPRESRFE